MAGELIRPGVEVLQTRKTASPKLRASDPRSLRGWPCFRGDQWSCLPTGPSTPRQSYGAYSQVGKTITQSSFPNPRANLDELDIQESTVRPFMLTGGVLSELLMAPGESFLAQSHGSSRAAFADGCIRRCHWSLP
jgi:hypothetical protein